MPGPVIISEEKAIIPNLEMPDWMDPKKIPKRCSFVVYIHYQPLHDIVYHSLGSLKNKLEVMGFLIGRVFYVGPDLTVVEIERIITSDLDATAYSVKFATEGLEKAAETLDDIESDLMIVGWYHSHPGYTCFLSSTDINTQKEMFPRPYHVAIVIDPLYDDIKAFSIQDDEILERTIITSIDDIDEEVD